MENVNFVAWDRSHDVFHNIKLPYICSMYDTGFKVLSMKINYLAEVANFHGQATDTYAYV
jgi:hypothetical protein